MTYNADINQTQAFGVGAVISESFAILLKKLPQIALVGFVPAVIGLIVSVMLIGPEMTFGGEMDPTGLQNVNWFNFGLSMIIQMVIYGLTVALLVQLAYDAKLGRPMSFGRYFNTAIRDIVPLIVLILIVSIVATFAMILLLLPGLWVYAVWSVVIPAIVIERSGFGALRRSAELTKGYRWPIVGTLIVLGLCAIVIGIGVSFLVAMVSNFTGGEDGAGVVIAVVIQALASAAIYGVIYIAIALIYARLREIKEGVNVDQLVSVFE